MKTYEELVKEYRKRQHDTVVDTIATGLSYMDQIAVDSGILEETGILTELTTSVTPFLPFVIISARSPSGIRPILQENHFTCPMISYSGALVLDENENYIGFKGALAENYVQNELKNLGYQPYFWRSGNQAEVDFLIERKGMLIPIEVKSAANTRAKSYRLL